MGDSNKGWFYRPVWIEQRIQPNPFASEHCEEAVVVFLRNEKTNLDLYRLLKKTFKKMIVVWNGDAFSKRSDVEYIVNPAKYDNYIELFEALSSIDSIPRRIIYLWNVLDEPVNLTIGTIESLFNVSFYGLLHISKALYFLSLHKGMSLSILINDFYNYDCSKVINRFKSLFTGPVQLIPREYTGIQCKCIEFSTTEIDSPCSEALINEILYDVSDANCVVLRGAKRFVRSAELITGETPERPENLLRSNGVYLITGGLGAIGFKIAEYLASSVEKPRLVLVGKTPFPPEEDWHRVIVDSCEDEKTCVRIRKVKLLRELGAEVLVVCADLTIPSEVISTLNQAEQVYGKINAVIHCAGNSDGGFLPIRTKELSESVFGPKIKGTLLMAEYLDKCALDFIFLCSSISSIIPTVGGVAYCSANSFLDAFANHDTEGRAYHIISVNWDTIRDIGMSEENAKRVAQAMNIPNYKLLLEDEGNAIPPDAIAEVFHKALCMQLPQMIVSLVDLQMRAERNARMSKDMYVKQFMAKLY